MKTMLINVTHAEESRVAIVEDGQLASFEIESLSREYVKGNIYKAIVRRIHPAIEAAFVDIGSGRDAFLPLDEICFKNHPGASKAPVGERGRRRIKDVIKSGDEVLVQITKEQFTNKPPTVSSFYSLPGRYLVLLPGSEDTGISRKIEGEERSRVRELLGGLKAPPGCGIIVRTAAGFDEDQGAELARDLEYLRRLWDSIKKNAQSKRAPELIYREHDVVLRNIRDYFTPDVSAIYVDDPDVYERARDFLTNVAPGKEDLLHLYAEEAPIFSHFGLEDQIESIYKRQVPLKSGGSIVIEATEALTSIDVNSGGSMRGASQEDTAYRTNMEAAREITRQLRLRDLGGIIVCDFIDMRVQSHNNDVERTVRDCMQPDKARHDIGRVSRLGLIEISRQRLRPAAAASAYATCPTCEGNGTVRTTESAALVVLRQIQQRIAQADVALMKVSVPHEVAMYLMNRKRDALAQLEARFATRIEVVSNPTLMAHQSEIDVRTRDVIVPLPALRPGEVVSAEAAQAPPAPRTRRASSTRRTATTRTPSTRTRRTATAAAAEATEETAEDGEKRRRGRRGGRGRRKADAADEGTESTSEAVDVAAAPAGDAAAAPAGDAAGGETAVPVAADAAPAVEASNDAEEAATPEEADPRLALYLLTDVPSGISLLAEDPLSVVADNGADSGTRRRRRRGGRRTTRGRRRESPAAAAGEPSGAAASNDAAPPAESDGPAAATPAPRRRRSRGGSGRRRRPSVAAEAGGDAAAVTEAAPESAAAPEQSAASSFEPPVDS